jgi:conjugative transfer signal peptidase TraF
MEAPRRRGPLRRSRYRAYARYVNETNPRQRPIATPASRALAGIASARGWLARRTARRVGGHPRHRRAAAALALAAAAVATVAAASAAAGLRFNTSGSLPRGLYRLTGATPRRFALVLVCPPPAAAALARRRRYLPAGPCAEGTRPLGKLLLAVPGDLIEVSAAGLEVAGRLAPFSRPLAADAAGRPLPRTAFGRRRLAPGEVWVYAPHPRSFDSRYFGPVPAASLRGTLVPVWVTSATASDRVLLDLIARHGAHGSARQRSRAAVPAVPGVNAAGSRAPGRQLAAPVASRK